MKYIAITLGPITRTIEMAESTKELWAASYFFSYLAKKNSRTIREKESYLSATSY
ncbi:type III-B CRISPR-associated protein Cas10/Cmr2 [Bacteroides fragilis]